MSAVIERPTREVQYCGETLVVSPITVGRMPAFARALRSCWAPVSVLAEDAISNKLQVGHLVQVIADHGDALTEAAAIATGRSVEFIGGGDTAEFIGLLQAIVGVNTDFFAQRLAPALAEMKTGLGTGKTPSNP